jgi:hypothetical protein
MGKVWLGKHTLRLYRALSSDEASILVQARPEHYGLNACLFRKKLVDSPLVSVGTATRQYYMCCYASIGMLKPAKRFEK